MVCYNAVEDMMTGHGEIIMIDREIAMEADTVIEVAHIKTIVGMTGGIRGIVGEYMLWHMPIDNSDLLFYDYKEFIYGY